MSQKGSTPILPILIVLLIALGIGGYLYSQQQSSSKFSGSVSATLPEIKPSLAPDYETANWKTYTDQELGISFLYPPYWGSLDKDEELCLPIGGPTREYESQPCVHISLSFSVNSKTFFATQSNLFAKYGPGRGGYWGDRFSLKKKINGITPEEFMNTLCLKSKLYECVKQINKNNVSYIKSLDDEQVIQSERKAHYYFVLNRNKDFPILLLSNQGFLDNMSLEEAEKVFDQILLTFKFTQ